MGDPTFGQRMAATIQAELGILSDDQEQIVANLIDREYSATQGKLAGFALEHPSPVRTGGNKERAELFDGLCGACGLQRDGMTVAFKRNIAVALTHIMAVTPNLTVNEIILRAREYRRKHAAWHLSPMSLAKYWSTCASAESIKGLLDEPVDWRARHKEIFPEEEAGATGVYFASQAWERIARPYQEKIVRFMSAPRPTGRQPHAD